MATSDVATSNDRTTIQAEIEGCGQGSELQEEPMPCPVDEAARIIGQKWMLQIVHHLLDCEPRRFCELQEALGGVNPSTLSSRLKMLEEEGLVRRIQVSAIPPHVEYSLTEMGCELRDVIEAIIDWSNRWLCGPESRRARASATVSSIAVPAEDCNQS